MPEVSSRFSFFGGSLIFCVRSGGAFVGAETAGLALKAKLNLELSLEDVSEL